MVDFLSVYSVHGGWQANKEYPRKYPSNYFDINKYNFMCVTTIKEISCEISFFVQEWHREYKFVNIHKLIVAILVLYIEAILKNIKPKLEFHLEISIPLVTQIMKFASLYLKFDT